MKLGIFPIYDEMSTLIAADLPNEFYASTHYTCVLWRADKLAQMWQCLDEYADYFDWNRKDVMAVPDLFVDLLNLNTECDLDHLTAKSFIELAENGSRFKHIVNVWLDAFNGGNTYCIICDLPEK